MKFITSPMTALLTSPDIYAMPPTVAPKRIGGGVKFTVRVPPTKDNVCVLVNAGLVADVTVNCQWLPLGDKALLDGRLTE
jgi:hypothetical protein